MPENAYNVDETRKSRRKERRQRLISHALLLYRKAKRLMREAKRREMPVSASVEPPLKISKPFEAALRAFEDEGSLTDFALEMNKVVQALAPHGKPPWAENLPQSAKNSVEQAAHESFVLQGDLDRASKLHEDPHADRKRESFAARGKGILQILLRIDSALSKQGKAKSLPEGADVVLALTDNQASLLEIYFADPIHHVDIGLDEPGRVEFAKAVAHGLHGTKITLPKDKALLKHGILALGEIADDEQENGNKTDAKALLGIAQKLGAYV